MKRQLLHSFLQAIKIRRRHEQARLSRSVPKSLLATFAGLIAAPGLFADSLLWSGEGVSPNWSLGANWTNSTTGTAGLVPIASDDVAFLDSVSLTPVVDGSFAGSIASLRLGSTNNDYTLTVAPGVTLNITGTNGLRVGTPGDTGNLVQRTFAFTGDGGALILNNPDANLVLNQGSATAVNASRATLDLSALDRFTANISRIGIGTTTLPNPGNANQREAGTLYLARTNVLTVGYSQPLSNYMSVAATTNGLEISHNPGNNGSTPSFLYLGQSNAFFIDSIGVGRSKASANSPGVIAFNPIFAGSGATAVFRGLGGPASRVSWWAIGDMSAFASSAQVAMGTNDFTGGTVDARVDVMSLGRDSSGNHTATGGTRVNTGILTFDNGRIDVNTLVLGNQSLGPASSVTPNLGVMNVVGAGATLVVNDTLTLGATAQSGIAATRTQGTLNITNGTVLANLIAVGASSTNNLINVEAGMLVVSNTLASTAQGLSTMNLSDATLQLQVGLTTPAAVVTNLATGGTGNTINIGPSPVLTSYPAQFALIKYAGTIGGAGFNFTTGAVPSHIIGYLSNNTFNSSVDFVVTTDPRPHIAPTNQPLAQSVSPGATAIFTVKPDGTPPFGYQWRRNGTNFSAANVSGINTDTLAINTAQVSDAADYTVVITNSFGSTTSLVAHLSVSAGNVAPSVTQQPQDATVTIGGTASFTVIASGSPVPTYRWRRYGTNLTDGGNISGATTSQLTISGAQPSDATTYSVGVTNVAGGIVSSNATLFVNVPPQITTQPQSLKVVNGQPAVFTVAATGTPAPTFQWRKNGNNIPGQTNATLSFAVAQPLDAAAYSVVAINPAGNDPSTNVTLIVNSTMNATNLFPANGATGVCVDTLLKITFSTPPAVGSSGTVKIFNVSDPTTPVDTLDLSLNDASGGQTRTIAGQAYVSYPIMVSGNTATIYPHLGVLSPGETYFVLVENAVGGVFKDASGATFTGISANNTWRFTTKGALPDLGATNTLVVAADGSGDFATVQGAIDFIPNANTTPITVAIRNGLYQELNRINGKHNLTFLGQDRKQTILAYPNNNNFQGANASTTTRVMFFAGGNDLVFANLTLTNSTPAGGSQAEALRVQGSRIIVDNCDLDSFQDTLLVNNATTSTLYANKSLIQGQTDFIWGSGIGFFQSCEIKAMLNGINTQPRTPATTYGFIFADCTLTRATTNVNSHTLARDGGNTFPNGNVAYLNCRMDAHITPAGWSDGGLTDKSQLRFWEYQSSDLAGNLLSAAARVPWSSQVDASTNAMLRDLNNVFGGVWTPQLAAYIASSPTNQTASVGQTVAITAGIGGIPEPSYQWMRYGTNLPGATNASFTIASAKLSDAGPYSVMVSNELATATSAAGTLSVVNLVRPTISGATRLPNGNVQFSFGGTVGQSYRVWGSTNVALTPITSTWTLLTNDVFSAATATFTDTQTAGFPLRFYVITLP